MSFLNKNKVQSSSPKIPPGSDSGYLGYAVVMKYGLRWRLARHPYGILNPAGYSTSKREKVLGYSASDFSMQCDLKIKLRFLLERRQCEKYCCGVAAFFVDRRTSFFARLFVVGIRTIRDPAISSTLEKDANLGLLVL